DADQWAGECMMVSADDPVVELYSILSGYANRQNRTPYSVRWDVEGASDASLAANVLPVDQFGMTNNTLTMPRHAGAQAAVTGQLIGAMDSKSVFRYVCVEPGIPHTLTLVADEGTAYMQGVGERKLRFSVKDRWGNSVKDNTVVDFVTTGDFILTERQALTEGGVVEVTVKGNEILGADSVLDVYVGSYLHTS